MLPNPGLLRGRLLAVRKPLGIQAWSGDVRLLLLSREVPTWFRQQNRDLNRKDVLTIKVMVKAIEIARSVLKQRRGWTELSGLVTALNKVGMLFGISHLAGESLRFALRSRPGILCIVNLGVPSES